MRRGTVTWILLSVATAYPARGEPRDAMSLVWNAPRDECPSEADVRAEVARLLQESSAQRTPVSARCDVTKGSDHEWSVRLQTSREGEHGERALSARSCVEVADAVALILAFMIDPSAVPAQRAAAAIDAAAPSGALDSSTPWLAPAPTAKDAATSDVEPRRKGASQQGAVEDDHFEVAAQAGADVGTLPGLAWGVALELAWLRGPSRIGLAGAWWPSQQAHVDVGSGGADFQLWTVSARYCYGLGGLRVSVAPCLGAEAGELIGNGFGVIAPNEASSLWLAATGGVRVRYAVVGLLEGVVELQGVVPAVRRSFVLDWHGEIHRSAALSGRMLAGAQLRFW